MELPHDDSAEGVLLGICVLQESATPLDGLDLSVFYSDRNRKVAREIVVMAAKGEPVTLSRVAERLAATVAASWIATLIDGLPFKVDAKFYRTRIIELAEYRRGVKLAHLLQDAYLSASEERIGKARKLLEGLFDGKWETTVPGVLASKVKPERVAWLWPNHIPLGKVTLFDGDPDLGKSLATIDLAARLSRGLPMPDGTELQCPPAGTVIVSLEDGVRCMSSRQ